MMSSGLISGPGRHWPCSSQISTVLLRQFSPPPITCGTFSGWVHDWVVREPVTFHLQPPTHGSTPEKKKPRSPPRTHCPQRQPQHIHLGKFEKVPNVDLCSKTWLLVKSKPQKFQRHTEPPDPKSNFKAKQRGCCMLGSGTKPSPLRKSQYSASLQQKKP